MTVSTPLHGLLDALPDAILVLDEHGDVLLANRRAGELFGASPPGLRELQALDRDGHELRLSQAQLDGAPVVVATLREAGDPESSEALQRLAAVVRSSPDAILTKDLNGTITSWNQGAEHIYGYTAAEIIGRPVSMLMDSDRHAENDRILERIRRGEVIEHFETVRVRKDGRALDVSISVSPVRDARGEIVGAATVGRDITERRRAEQRFRSLLESAPDAVVVIGPDGCIALVNRQTEELFGYTREELIGRPPGMLIPERLRAPSGGYFSAAGSAFEMDGLRADGGEFPIDVTLSPLSTDEGTMTYIAIRDITDRRLMEDELRRSNHDLEQFAYVASHDLSEPLRVISGFVELLSRRYGSQLDEEGERFIDFILTGVERMQALIDDLLAYSRAGRATLDPREVDVAALVEDLLRALRPELEARGVDVQVGTLPSVRAEKSLLRQVIQNLISNAVKFSDAAAPVVRVSSERVPGAWCFAVADNGPGVEPRYRERIFEMFQRLHGRDVPGSGIGLAIVKRLVERHGGRVWVSDASPRGATFNFTIPDRVAAS
ncbi:MAG TPA: PAS domain S-box protein [Solirubrobacteraceae bacterium]|nr:PAS domain S-box protein [Solirubrobacteraceae bacterium]